MKLETLAVHGGYTPDPTTKAVAVPIYQTVAYAFDTLHLHRLEADPALRRWVDDQLRRPVDPVAVAAPATSPEIAAEIYLASVLVVDETTVMERAYLDELARQLRLDPGLKADLERRAAE